MNALTLPLAVLPAGLLALSLMAVPAAGAVRYVKPDAPGTNAGTSWTNAYRDLRTALTAAVAGDQIWIAAGIYYADYNAATNTRTGDRSLRFPLKSQITVLGGFAGTETAAAQRDWRVNRTILNGEAGSTSIRQDNTMTIMGSFGALTGIVIDGLVFANGYADDPREIGGGDLIGGNGGALYISGEATVRHCVFVNNYAIYGGAIKVYSNSTRLQVEQCLFAFNQARYVGGAIDFHAWRQPLSLTHCTLTGNSAQRGSGIGVNGGPVTYRGNVFYTNTAETTSGASVLENNLWPMSPEEGTGNATSFAWPFTRSPSAGPDGLWGTMDDELEAPLRADSPAVNLSRPDILPADTADADGDGDVNEKAPFDAAHRPRVNDGPPDAGAFEMVNVAPASLTLTLTELIEASPADTLAGYLAAGDENGGAQVFALVPGSGDAGNASFTITGNELRAVESFDFETQATYSVRIRATDSMGLLLEKVFTIPITDRIEQTVWIETVKAGGTEPAGGVSGRTGPGGWPEHWAVARLRRSGPDAAGPLDLSLKVTDGTSGEGDQDDDAGYYGIGSEFRIHTGSGAAAPAWTTNLPLHLNAGQPEMFIGIEPLFDFSPVPEAPGTVTLTVMDGMTRFVTGTPGSAVLTLYDSPAARWSAETGIAADAEGLALYALGNSVGIAPCGNASVTLAARLNPDAPDVAVTWEQSENLALWTPATPLEILWPPAPGQPAQWCLPAAGARRFYRPRGIPAAQPMGFGTGVDAAKMVFIPAGAGYIPRGLSTGDLRFLFSHPFWIGKMEVSGDDFHALGLDRPAGPFPVTGITPAEIAVFCARAVERQYYGPLPPGYVLRLPTEAEWIYAASPPYAFAPQPGTPLGTRAWYLDNAFGVIHRVGTRLPNERGIHDMLGNVSEWTTHRLIQPAMEDLTADESNTVPDAAFAIICGGNIWQGAVAQTTSQRAEYPVTDPSPLIGFRPVIARPLPSVP